MSGLVPGTHVLFDRKGRGWPEQVRPWRKQKGRL